MNEVNIMKKELVILRYCIRYRLLLVRVRWDAAENSDESEDSKNKNRFFNIIIQQ
jgi:hypothetical protein